MHLFVLASVRLDSVTVAYSGILHQFASQRVIATGASGDGKSIGVWFQTQCMHYFRKQLLKQRDEQIAAAEESHRAWEESGKEGSEPVIPCDKSSLEELYDGGSILGLGMQMSENHGRALWLKHEAKDLLSKLLEGGPAGSLEDINGLSEHAFFKNAPLTASSRFRVENPHLCGFWLCHLEELEPLLNSASDTTNAMQRFLIAHWPAVINKILPADGEAEVARLLAESEDWFNSVSFDDAILSVVNPLLVLDSLYVLGKPRADELDGLTGTFSKLSGLHSLGWQPEARRDFVRLFNEHVDKQRQGMTRPGTRLDAAKLSKDKTRTLQFLPTSHLLESVLQTLATHAAPGSRAQDLSPESYLKVLASANMDEFRKTFKPDSIASLVTIPAVKAANALAHYFAKQYSWQSSARAHVAAFKTDRAAAACFGKPRADIIFQIAQRDDVILPGSPGSLFAAILDGSFHWESFAKDSMISVSCLYQRKYEIYVLLLCGLVGLRDAEIHILRRGEDAMAESLMRLNEFDSLTDLGALDMAMRSQEYHTTDDVAWRVPAEAYAVISTLLMKYAAGEEITEEAIRTCPDPHGPVGASTQRAKEHAAEPPKLEGQADARAMRAEDGLAAAKRRKTNYRTFSLTAEEVAGQADVVRAVSKYILQSKTVEHTLNKMAARFATSLPEESQQRAILVAFKWLDKIGVARLSDQMGSVKTCAVPEEVLDLVVGEIAAMLDVSKTEVKKVMRVRPVAEIPFPTETWQEWLRKLPSAAVPPEVAAVPPSANELAGHAAAPGAARDEDALDAVVEE